MWQNNALIWTQCVQLTGDQTYVRRWIIKRSTTFVHSASIPYIKAICFSFPRDADSQTGCCWEFRGSTLQSERTRMVCTGTLSLHLKLTYADRFMPIENRLSRHIKLACKEFPQLQRSLGLRNCCRERKQGEEEGESDNYASYEVPAVFGVPELVSPSSCYIWRRYAVFGISTLLHPSHMTLIDTRYRSWSSHLFCDHILPTSGKFILVTNVDP